MTKMQPAISQVCSLNSPFENDLAGYADAAVGFVEIWLTKLEEYLKTHTVAEVKAIAADRGLQFAAASYQGGLLVSQGTARREAWSLFERRLDLCAEVGVPVIVVVADFLAPVNDADVARAQVSLKQAGQAARQRGVKVALEFQARSMFVNNLETAALFVRSVDEPNVGLCFDVFHYSVGPSKYEDLVYLTRDNLFHVQVCDVADRPRELAADADRILPGDGDFRLQPLFDHFRNIGYEGCLSLELLNPTLWQIPPQQLGEIGITALRVALGQARQ